MSGPQQVTEHLENMARNSRHDVSNVVLYSKACCRLATQYNVGYIISGFATHCFDSLGKHSNHKPYEQGKQEADLMMEWGGARRIFFPGQGASGLSPRRAFLSEHGQLRKNVFFADKLPRLASTRRSYALQNLGRTMSLFLA
jgi:hypothetical protein